jgi:hypothetical protein
VSFKPSVYPWRPALNGSLDLGHNMESESRASFQLKISFCGVERRQTLEFEPAQALYPNESYPRLFRAISDCLAD